MTLLHIQQLKTVFHDLKCKASYLVACLVYLDRMAAMSLKKCACNVKGILIDPGTWPL